MSIEALVPHSWLSLTRAPGPEYGRWMQPSTSSISGGLCFAGAPDEPVEDARRHNVLSRRGPILDLVARARERAASPAHAAIDTLGRAARELDDDRFLRTFERSGVVTRLRMPERTGDDTVGKALALSTVLIGAPDIQRLHLDLPAGSVAAATYLPHPNLTLREARALTVDVDGELVGFGWADRTRLMVPRDGVESWADLGSTRVWAAGRVGPWAVLNDRAPIHARQASVPAPCEAELSHIAAGLEALSVLWPEVRAAAQRWLHDTLVLEPAPAGGYYSFTTVDAPGTHFASALSWVQVGDSLVHELAHARELVVKDLDPLILDDGEAVHVSPWREDPRPLAGLASGIHSFVNVHAYYARVLGSAQPSAIHALAEQKVRDHGQRLRQAWPYVLARARWTPVGERLASELDAYVRAL